ncbi:MAG: DNA polymerase III subunit delta' [Propionibacterium sp.]|nr:DNA polymerase III subunit delta' [Propionibacterium sp.]
MTTTASSPLTGVWADLVGQENAVTTLRRAVSSGHYAMSHAWLITGPPGSGRSNAARAFAAALQCENQGCGQCQACVTSLSGAHPDVTLVRTEQLSIGVKEVRDLVRRAAMSPVLGRWQVIVVEDADRVTDQGADALLKSVEEPAPGTVWLLCAPTSDDVSVTIRSRCRSLNLTTPRTSAVTGLLIERGIDPELADEAARAAQGHIGRANRLARDAEARERRRQILKIPGRLSRGLSECLAAADELVKAAAEEAKQQTETLDATERAELEQALGFGTKGARPKQAAAALKELTEQQSARAKRLQRDALDRALTELTTWYRDVLSIQLGSGAGLINTMDGELTEMAESSSASDTVHRVDALLECRTMLETNVAPLLAVERLMIALARPGMH